MVWERAMLSFEFAVLLAARGRDAEAVRYLTGGLNPGAESRPRWWPGDSRDVEKGMAAPAEQLRSIGDAGAAEQVEVLLGKALRESGEVAAAEKLLRRLVDGMDPDARSRPDAAYQWAATLDALGRTEQAEAVREREGLDQS
jgi:tetratricopeptide (TPR) repeat protein